MSPTRYPPIRRPIRRLALNTLILASLMLSGALAAEEKSSIEVDMAAMMAKAKTLIQPSEHHQLLKRFLGTWDTELRVTMMGNDAPPHLGTATFSWLMEGRWLKQESTGTIMGQPTDGFMILGYDNFKQSYVTVAVGTVDTAMLNSEGDLDPSGNVLITYGTLDEYLSGEHDKMVKYVWRFVSEDKMVFEVHDLPIGELNTKVVEITYNRRPQN